MLTVLQQHSTSIKLESNRASARGAMPRGYSKQGQIISKPGTIVLDLVLSMHIGSAVQKHAIPPFW